MNPSPMMRDTRTPEQKRIAALEKLCRQQHEALEALTHGGSGVGRAKEWEDAETAITAYAALFPKTGGAK